MCAITAERENMLRNAFSVSRLTRIAIASDLFSGKRHE